MLRDTFFQYILPILVFYSVAYIIHRLSNPIARRFNPIGNITMRDNPRRYDRLRTLHALLTNAISIAGFVAATLATLTLFFSADTLLWVLGLFSAAFGLGARPFISDFLTGLSFIFEDTFDVGDKIELPLIPKGVEGVVEAVNLRVTRLRGMDGEMYSVPNGDIRMIRNFSRGEYSTTSVTIKIPAAQLTKTLDRLEVLGVEAMTLLPNLIEPWQVISMSGELGEEAELTILAKARFGKGAEMRMRLLALLQEQLSHLNVVDAKRDSTSSV